MTKQVRIENADTSDYHVRVYIEQRGADGVWQRVEHSVTLDFPTAIHAGYVHAGQRLVIEEG